ncbi:MAG: dockerin type I domain-containing protein [Ruminococcus flavefaciens]|nr:dockerin type I domain-containing protein [Ruminococcus flavefaciens]MCM1061282.1 dockerin type I domain-containing protein [Eubacterium sp.]
MHFFKSIITSFITTATAICSLSAINAYAAEQTTPDPNIYIDMTIEESGAIRADVIMENFPEFNEAAFRINLGNNWEAVTKPNGEPKLKYTDRTMNDAEMKASKYVPSDNGNYVTLIALNYADMDFNGTFVSFYIKKSDIFNWTTSGVNFVKDPTMYKITDSKGNEYFNSILETAPIMIGADEYIVGDVNNSLFVDGTDATLILRFINLNGNSVPLSDINSYLNEVIHDLRSAYAADVNKDGYIDETDAQLTLRYYTEIISGSEYSGRIGTTDIYEIYND